MRSYIRPKEKAQREIIITCPSLAYLLHQLVPVAVQGRISRGLNELLLHVVEQDHPQLVQSLEENLATDGLLFTLGWRSREVLESLGLCKASSSGGREVRGTVDESVGGSGGWVVLDEWWRRGRGVRFEWGWR